MPGSIAEQALQRIAALYTIEAQIRGQPPDVRHQVRQARAGPLLDDLRAWLTSMLGKVSRKSELAKAIGYSLTRWTSLTRYRDDGRIEIDTDAFDKRNSVTPRGSWALPWLTAPSSSRQQQTDCIPLRPCPATPAPCLGRSSSCSHMRALACCAASRCMPRLQLELSQLPLHERRASPCVVFGRGQHMPYENCQLPGSSYRSNLLAALRGYALEERPERAALVPSRVTIRTPQASRERDRGPCV